MNKLSILKADAFDLAVKVLLTKLGGSVEYRYPASITVAFESLDAADAAKVIIDGLVGSDYDRFATGEVYGMGRLVIANPHAPL